jgi:hypothetical protein
MSRKEIDICDYCDKQTYNWEDELGWLHFESSTKLAIGMDTPLTLVIPAFQDFCSLRCFSAFIQKVHSKDIEQFGLSYNDLKELRKSLDNL